MIYVVRVLFLDDDPYRSRCFSQEFAVSGVSVDYAGRASEAIDLIGRGAYDVYSLDHDLCEEHYDGFLLEHRTGVVQYGATPTGLFVAQSLRERGHCDGRRAVVHSHNLYGSTRMVKVLADAFAEAVAAPFGTAEYEGVMRKWLAES